MWDVDVDRMVQNEAVRAQVVLRQRYISDES